MAKIGDMLRLVMIATLLALAAATDYSKKGFCKKGKIHTMLKYPNKPAAACGKVLNDKCTEDDKKNILAEHNRLRKLVATGQVSGQPAAVSIPDMVWDDKIANVAQRWAKQCIFGHDQCRNTETYVGQNVAIKHTTMDHCEPAGQIIQWFKENENFGKQKEITKYTGEGLGQVGHYTQLVWAESTKLGCGCMNYKNGEWNTCYLVCNYGPGGNIIGQPIYQIKE